MISHANAQSRRLALVTGATKGIGRAIATQLVADGYEVVGTGRGEAPKDCPYHRHEGVDFADDTSFEGFIERIRMSSFSVLVNNAGINRISPFGDIPDADFDLIQKVNLRRPFQICQAVLPQMRKNHWGRIVNISSIFGKITRPYRASYSASKFGLDGMTAALATEVAEYNILANCVAPGFVDTELTRNVLGESGMSDLAQQVPMRRLARPEEIASLVSWLVSDRNSYLTGQNIAIDGGFTRV